MMAQAPQTPQGPPRKTSTYKQFSGMNSQDGRFGVEQDEFFYLENIMRVADGKLRSVPGPSAAQGNFPPIVTDQIVLGSGNFEEVLGTGAPDEVLGRS